MPESQWCLHIDCTTVAGLIALGGPVVHFQSLVSDTAADEGNTRTKYAVHTDLPKAAPLRVTENLQREFEDPQGVSRPLSCTTRPRRLVGIELYDLDESLKTENHPCT